jgi:hypothetical protein
MITDGSLRRKELANRGTLALPGEPPPQLTRHHSRRRSTTKDRPMSYGLTPGAGAGLGLGTFSLVTDASSRRMRATVWRCLCHVRV